MNDWLWFSALLATAVLFYCIGKAQGQLAEEERQRARLHLLNKKYGVSDLDLPSRYEEERAMRIELEQRVNRFELGLEKPKFQ
jgi:hypothetical protein